MHSGRYAYRDRKQIKRNFRKLWITRINAACREREMSYSRFISGLIKAGVEVNRKMLSEIAISDPKAFDELVETAKKGLDGKITKEEAKSNEEVTISKSTVKTTTNAPTKENKKEVEKTDYSKLSLAELKTLAKENGIKGYSTMKKAELINALK